jgi:hypothetical protein
MEVVFHFLAAALGSLALLRFPVLLPAPDRLAALRAVDAMRRNASKVFIPPKLTADETAASRDLRDAQADFGCTSGTEGPVACMKRIFARSIRVPRQKSARGSTTLKFLCM